MDRSARIGASRHDSGTARVLYVARSGGAASPVHEALGEAGLQSVETVADGRRALPSLREIQPDVVLLDANVEGLDVVSVARQIGARTGPDEILPIVILAPTDRSASLRASLEGIDSVFVHDPANPTGAALLVRELAAVRGSARVVTQSLARRLAGAYRLEAEAAHHLAMFAELKDHPASGHVFRVGQLSADIASALGFEPETVELIRIAAPLHDVGKIGIPDAILFKEEPLSLDELDVIKTHTAVGASILAGSTSALFQMAEEIALFHHENWDGTGYTPGLESDAIPLVGRIVRVVDSFDAITSSRPFAERWHRHHALDFIREQAGHAFDPHVVEAFLDVIAEDEPADVPARGAA